MRTTLRKGYDPTDEIPDVWVHDGFYGDLGVVAWTDCNASRASSRTQVELGYICVGQDIRYNSEFAEYYTTQDQRRGIACHEIGHTVGLAHAAIDEFDEDCMTLGYPLGTGTSKRKPTVLDDHSIQHINAYYD